MSQDLISSIFVYAILPAILAVIGWLASGRFKRLESDNMENKRHVQKVEEEVDEIRVDLNKWQLNVVSKFAEKDELRRLDEEVNRKLDRILEIIERKADK